MNGITDGKKYTFPYDPRDVSNSEWVKGERRRKSLDELGDPMWDQPSEDALRVLMECGPSTEPVFLEEDPPFTYEMAAALDTLSDKEYQVVLLWPTPVRETADLLGLSKSAVHRARQSGFRKLREALLK